MITLCKTQALDVDENKITEYGNYTDNITFRFYFAVITQSV